jgi:uncharacterized protein (TIGR02466 family)
MIELIFPSFFSSHKLDLPTEELKEYCRNSSKNLNYNQKRPDIVDMSVPCIQEMFTKVEEKFNETFHNLDYRPELSLQISQAWSNVGNHNWIDEPHIHPDSFFSGTLYLTDYPETGDHPNKGELVFVNPNVAGRIKQNPNLLKQINLFTSDSVIINPEVNKLVIFPSWIMHYVRQNRTETERISIAFDTIIKK